MARANVIGHQNVFTEAMANAGKLVTDAMQIANQRQELENNRRLNNAVRLWEVVKTGIAATPGEDPKLWLEQGGNQVLMDTMLDNLGVVPSQRRQMIEGMMGGDLRFMTKLELAMSKMSTMDIEGWLSKKADEEVAAKVATSEGAPVGEPATSTTPAPSEGPSQREERQFEHMGTFPPVSPVGPVATSKRALEGVTLAPGPMDPLVGLPEGGKMFLGIPDDPEMGGPSRREKVRSMGGIRTALDQTLLSLGWGSVLKDASLREEFDRRMTDLNGSGWDKRFDEGRLSRLEMPNGAPGSFAYALQGVLLKSNRPYAEWLSATFGEK